MKEIFKIIYALLVGLIGENADESVQEVLKELSELIDKLEDEAAGDESGDNGGNNDEITNKINTIITNLLSKVENKKENEENKQFIKNEMLKIQKKMLQNKIDSLPDHIKNRSVTVTVWNGIKYEEGKTIKFKNLLTLDDGLIPTFIADEVISTMPENENFLSHLNYIGNYRKYAVPIDNYTDNEATERAGAWAGNGAEKTEQTINLVPKNIVSQPLYKLAGISWEELDVNNGILPKFRIVELTQRWLEEYMRAVLVGDGRAVSNNRHITSLVPIKRDASDEYVTVITPTAAPTLKSVRAAIVANIEHPSRAILVANATTLNNLQEISTTTGLVDYLTNATLAEKLQIKAVYKNNHLLDNEIIVFGRYDTIGNSSPEQIEGYEIKTNTDYVELIGMVGGDLVEPKSGLVINPPTP